MENQYKSKKSTQKHLEDNKLYIEFLKHCEIDQSTVIPTCFSPTSTSGVRSHGNSYSHKNLNSFFDSNQNILSVGGVKTHNNININNNIQSSVQLRIGSQFTSNTPSSANTGVTTLFDFMLKKHDQLYTEIVKQKANSMPKPDRKSLLLNQTKTDDKKIKINFTTTNQNNFDIGGGDSRRNTVQVGSHSSNNYMEENNNFSNVLLKEETIKVIFKNPSSLTIQKFKVKIVPLIMQEPLLAISIQDITQNEEEKKVKRIEQDNNTINLQVISKIKNHLEYLYRNLSKIKSQRMKQAIIFPLNIIRSTAIIEKNKINYEPFSLNVLLKDLATTFTNVVQVKVKQNKEQNYLNKLASKTDGNLIQSMEECLSEDEGELQEYDLIDPQSFEEQEYQDEVRLQKESIVSKYNLAGIISANHDFLSFSTQNQFSRQQTNQLSSLQHIHGGDFFGFRGVTKQVTSELSIPIGNVSLTKQPLDKLTRDERISSCQDINQEIRKHNFLKNGNKIPIRQKNDEKEQISLNEENPNRKNWMVKSISNDHLNGKRKNDLSNKLKEGHNSYIVVGTTTNDPLQPSSQSAIQSKQNKQKLVSQINNKLKLLDDQTINRNHLINQQEQRQQVNNTTDDHQKRGQSIPSTTTGASYLQQASLMQIKQTPQEIEEQSDHHLSDFQVLPIKKTSIHQNNYHNNNTNFKHLSAHNLFVHPSNNNQNNSSMQYIREDRHSSIGQQSSNNMPSVTQIDQDIIQVNQPKKHNYNLHSQMVGSYRFEPGTGPNSLVNSNHLQYISNRNLTVPLDNVKLHNQENSCLTNIQYAKSSTHLETDGNEIASEREQKLNTILNNPSKKSMKGEIKLLSNYRLVFQALCGIITCFGQQNVQIIIETFNKKLYNSIRFKIKPAQKSTPGSQKNTNTNHSVATGITPVFNFENSPQLTAQHPTHIHQYSMFPNLNLTAPNYANNMSPASNYSNRLNTHQIAVDTLNSPHKIQSKQSSTAKTTKFDVLSTKKLLLTEDDFKRNLYDLNQLTNKQLSNKIWKSIKEIAASIGPESLEFSENTISIEFFTNMNIIRDPKFSNQEINLNAINNSKPNRNSLFSIKHNMQSQLVNSNINQQQSQSNNSNNLQTQNNNLTAQFNSLSVKDNLLLNNSTNHINSVIINQNNNLLDYISQNASVVQNNLSITNNFQSQQRFEPLSITNKNSFNNIYQQNNNTSFQNCLSNTYLSEQNGILSTQQQIKIPKPLSKIQQNLPSFQPSNNQPFMINSKLRIPEEEEQQPYKKKLNSIASLSLLSLQSQQDEGVKEVQPIKNFLNQNAKFSSN